MDKSKRYLKNNQKKSINLKTTAPQTINYIEIYLNKLNNDYLFDTEGKTNNQEEEEERTKIKPRNFESMDEYVESIFMVKLV